MEPTIFKPRLKFKPPFNFFKFGHRKAFNGTLVNQTFSSLHKGFLSTAFIFEKQNPQNVTLTLEFRNQIIEKSIYSFIYILKQDIRTLYVAYRRPNGWTDWAEIFCGHSWVAAGCYRLNKILKSFLQIFLFFTGNAVPFS